MMPWTTTITIKRQADEDPYDRTSAIESTIAAIPAHISFSRGSESIVGGERSTIFARCICGIIDDVRHTDTLIDNTTDDQYLIQSVISKVGFGLDHLEIDLLKVEAAGE